MSPDPCHSAPCYPRMPLRILYSVKGIPGTLQEGGAAFATTHWSVVEACADDDNADIALARLCQDYRPPLYTFARRRGNGSADAQDSRPGVLCLPVAEQVLRPDRSQERKVPFVFASVVQKLHDRCLGQDASDKTWRRT